MALFRTESNVETVNGSCPICHSDVKGNDAVLYYCQKCNILFRKEDLVLTKEDINDLLKKKIAEKFGQDKDKIKIEQENIPAKELSEKKQLIVKEIKESKKYYLSKKSNVVHVSNCPYGKNIKKENKVILKSLEGLKTYKKCKCMTEY